MSFFPGKDPAAGDKFQCDAIKALIVPRTADLGDGFTVRRALPSAQSRMVGPFVFFDHFGPTVFRVRQRPRRAAASAYRARHRDLSVRRRDHAPRQPRHRRADPARRGQLDDRRARHRAFRTHRHRNAAPRATACTACRCGWRCPPAQEEMAPAFAHHAVDEFPMVRDNGKTVRVVVGSLYGARSPVATTSRDAVRRRACSRPAARLPLDADHEERAIYVLDGEIDIAGDKFGAEPPAGVQARRHDHHPRADRRAFRRSVGGEPMDGPRHIWWNFVSSRKERIEQAKAEWTAGHFQQGAGRRDRVHPAAGEIGPVRVRHGTNGSPARCRARDSACSFV